MIMPAFRTLKAHRDEDCPVKSMFSTLRCLFSFAGYFRGIGYECEGTPEGEGSNELIDRYKGQNGMVVLRTSMEPLPDELKARIMHDWEFQCPDKEAEMHIDNLKKIYEAMKFEVDE